MVIGLAHFTQVLPVCVNRRSKPRRVHGARSRANSNHHTTTLNQSTAVFRQEIARFSSEYPQYNPDYFVCRWRSMIVHRSVSAPLYSQPPSQLVPTGLCTGSGSRTRSGRTALQVPRVTSLNQSEDTSNPVFHRT